MSEVQIETEEGASAFNTLMQVCPDLVCGVNTDYNIVLTGRLIIQGDIGSKGWEILGEAMQLRPGILRHIEVPKSTLDGLIPHEGRKDILRKIWDNMGWEGWSGEWLVVDPSQSRCFTTWYVKRQDEEEGWQTLEEILDASEEDIFGKTLEGEELVKRLMGGGDNDEEEDAIEEEDETEEEDNIEVKDGNDEEDSNDKEDGDEEEDK